jgi:ribose-phosphate pyrophosphokinase
MENRGKLSIFSCEAGKPFFDRVLFQLKEINQKHFGTLGGKCIHTPKTIETKFANGEIKTEIRDYIRGNDVYIIQEFDSPRMNDTNSLHDNIMALLTAVDAARNADADGITVVIPQFPYSKHEKTSKREGIAARLIASMLEDAGVDRVLTLDIHEKAIQGFFDRARLDNMYASREFIKYIRESKPNYDDMVVVAHDLGAAEVARYYAAELKVDMAIVRAYTISSEVDDKFEFQLVGDVKDKHVIMVKDMISTGNTIFKAIDILLEKGALSVQIFTSMPFFNRQAYLKMEEYYQEGKIKKVVGTDAVFWGEEFINKYDWYEEVSIASLFAEVIFHINHKLSVAELLYSKNEEQNNG